MIVFEPFCGASGDMLLGALVDLGAPAMLLEKFAALRLPDAGALAVTCEKVMKRGIAATAVRVEAQDEPPERSSGELYALLDLAAECVGASGTARDRARSALTLLLEAEAAVHGAPLEHVHLHEAGSIDTIVDMLGFFMLLEALGERDVHALPLHVGRGGVTTRHGRLPVPVPAVSAIAARCGIPLVGGPVEGELTTPTGIALLASCALFRQELPSLVPLKVGYGAGSRELPVANVLRATLAAGRAREDVWVVEASIDDATGEEMGSALERMHEVSLEAHLLQAIGKKGRPLFLLRALVEQEQREAAVQRMLQETPTLGVRFWPVGREKMERRIETRTVTVGDVSLPLRVKISRLGELEKEKVEADDLALLKEHLACAGKGAAS